MVRLPASPAEPRHTRGGAGGAGVADLPPWHGQKIRVPKRVWSGGHYSPGAVAAHAQLTALDQRGRRCRATVATLAGYLGDGKRTVERFLAELAAPAPDGGRPELETVRHTAAGGTGESAERRIRRVERGEHFAYVPIAAAKGLRHRLFVAYCALAYAQATNTPVTAAELAALLAVTERSARRLVDELEAAGWITVDRRTGRQARHEITVHDHPLHLVPGPPAADTDGGSGPGTDGGSLAIKEDPVLTDDENNTPPGGGVRRRRGDRKWAPGPVDNSAAAPATFRSAGARRPYDGPSLSLSPRVWDVLGPVVDLLPRISPFVLRTAAREIGRQLDAQVHPDDLHDQILHRRQRTGAANLAADPGRWLLGVALAAWTSPCGLADCVDGLIRHTGTPCKACAALPLRRYRGRARGHPPPTTTAVTAQRECPGCSAPYRPPLRHPNCRLCHHPLTA
ncbi:SgrR family transcriptional regulator [Streptomyces scabiei]|uniref:SgrR family transcriptional regulator n=1 Tax=Streptomyces scabiei TaxID=1930 RepID=UPI0039EF9092